MSVLSNIHVIKRYVDEKDFIPIRFGDIEVSECNIDNSEINNNVICNYEKYFHGYNMSIFSFYKKNFTEYLNNYGIHIFFVVLHIKDFENFLKLNNISILNNKIISDRSLFLIKKKKIQILFFGVPDQNDNICEYDKKIFHADHININHTVFVCVYKDNDNTKDDPLNIFDFIKNKMVGQELSEFINDKDNIQVVVDQSRKSLHTALQIISKASIKMRNSMEMLLIMFDTITIKEIAEKMKNVRKVFNNNTNEYEWMFDSTTSLSEYIKNEENKIGTSLIIEEFIKAHYHEEYIKLLNQNISDCIKQRQNMFEKFLNNQQYYHYISNIILNKNHSPKYSISDYTLSSYVIFPFFEEEKELKKYMHPDLSIQGIFKSKTNSVCTIIRNDKLKKTYIFFKPFTKVKEFFDIVRSGLIDFIPYDQTKKGLKVHKGVYNIFQSLLESTNKISGNLKLEPTIWNLKEKMDEQIIFCGFSMGGALSIICQLYFGLEGNEIYLFGPMKPGNQKLLDTIDHENCKIFVTCEKDKDNMITYDPVFFFPQETGYGEFPSLRVFPICQENNQINYEKSKEQGNIWKHPLSFKKNMTNLHRVSLYQSGIFNHVKYK